MSRSSSARALCSSTGCTTSAASSASDSRYLATVKMTVHPLSEAIASRRVSAPSGQTRFDSPSSGRIPTGVREELVRYVTDLDEAVKRVFGDELMAADAPALTLVASA